jgi:hypothetical protein
MDQAFGGEAPRLFGGDFTKALDRHRSQVAKRFEEEYLAKELQRRGVAKGVAHVPTKKSLRLIRQHDKLSTRLPKALTNADDAKKLAGEYKKLAADAEDRATMAAYSRVAEDLQVVAKLRKAGADDAKIAKVVDRITAADAKIAASAERGASASASIASIEGQLQQLAAPVPQAVDDVIVPPVTAADELAPDVAALAPESAVQPLDEAAAEYEQVSREIQAHHAAREGAPRDEWRARADELGKQQMRAGREVSGEQRAAIDDMLEAEHVASPRRRLGLADEAARKADSAIVGAADAERGARLASSKGQGKAAFRGTKGYNEQAAEALATAKAMDAEALEIQRAAGAFDQPATITSADDILADLEQFQGISAKH